MNEEKALLKILMNLKIPYEIEPIHDITTIRLLGIGGQVEWLFVKGECVNCNITTNET